ncbi:MAG TPA: folylpolyglutamate synthase/dihydrofolate synthase family protein [Bacteroidia bacterium]|nr:folylpolyglutamate synthase/dihydrofolate synthase family protein [Bacteroidia bacterium]
MKYQQTLDYLFARLPMYQRVGAAAYKADLDNTLKIIEILGKPHLKVKCIHVAGTNGKGSSSHMLAAILQQSGYKTGLYTSPHLIDFRERIRINGKMIPKNHIIDFVEKYKEPFEQISPSFFEWTVGLALDYFANEEVDVAIIEVGLGGRLDSTNIISPKTCLITNISFDHMNLLGDSLEKIGREKAGIIKPRVPVVISQYQTETASMFNNVARELKAPIEFADKNYKILDSKLVNGLMHVTILDRKKEKTTAYDLDLTGNYQLKNLLGVLNVLEFIEKAGFILEEEHVRTALKNVCKLTGLAGRWQKLSEKPLIIADTGHNEDGIKQVIENLKMLSYEKLHFVFGAVNDKDISKILTLLPKAATYYFVKANIPRALDETELLHQAHKVKLEGKAFGSVAAGLAAAKKACKKNDLILVGGSTFVVGDALLLLNP